MVVDGYKDRCFNSVEVISVEVCISFTSQATVTLIMADTPTQDPFFDDVFSPDTGLRDSIAEVVEVAQSRATEKALDLSRGDKEVDNPKGGSKTH